MSLEEGDLWGRAEEVFHEVMEAPPAERGGLAERLCGGDGALLTEVRSLLASAAGTFLETPAVELGAIWSGLLAGEESDPLIGRRVGEYEIRERIGSGGMGVVYLAHQDNPSREVALKLMRPGAMSASLTRRFEHEAQILGRLQHPGIAQVYGAGRVRAAGRTQPYFAMEYVRGEPLREFVRSRGLTTAARVMLAAAVCDAVQHAHTKGVIHRDLKPANILVTEGAGGVGAPKILDFGVARVTESDLQITSQTSVGEIIGTLAYMSPEQVRGDGAEIDTRTDVYALGVILYEVLSGRLPLDLSGRSVAQAAPAILEEEPARLGTLDRSLRGDLEVIAAKALEKDKARRYQTAAALAEDLRRVLADEPIQARPPTAAYQLRKFARRNRALVWGAATALVLLAAGAAGTGIGLVRARVAAAQASRTVDFLTTILTSANPTVSRGRELTVRELVDEAAVRASTELADQPEVEFRTRLALSRTYMSLNLVEPARAQAERAKALAAAQFGPRTLEYSEALAAAAAAFESREKSAASVAAAREVLDLRLALLRADHRLVALARVALAKALSNLSQFEEAEGELRAAYGVLRRAHDPALAACASVLAEHLLRAPGGAGLAEAEGILRPAVEDMRRRGAQAEPDLASTLMALGTVLTRQKRYDEAVGALTETVEIRRRLFPANHPATFSARLRLVQAVRALGRYEEALKDARALLEEEVRALGAGTPEVVNTSITLGRILEEMRDFLGAAEAYGRGAESSTALKDAMQAQICWQMQAQCLVDAGRRPEAEAPLRAALEVARLASKKGFTLVALTRALAGVLAESGRHEERLSLLREALAFAEGSATGGELAAELRGEAAAALIAAGRVEAGGEAEGLLRRALEDWVKAGKRSRAAGAAAALGDFLAGSGRAEEAAKVRAEHPAPEKPDATEGPDLSPHGRPRG